MNLTAAAPPTVLLLDRILVDVAPHVVWERLVAVDEWATWTDVLRCPTRLGRPLASGDELTLEVDARVGTRHSRIKVTTCREPVHVAWTHNPLDWGRNSAAATDWWFLPRTAATAGDERSRHMARPVPGPATLVVNRRRLVTGNAAAAEISDLASSWQASVHRLMKDLAAGLSAR